MWAFAAASALAQAATPVTRAALPPAASAGRGATVPFVEYEAENGVTNGEIIGPDRTFGTLAAEASGRRAVKLAHVGDYVEIVLAHPANAVTLRYALPDSADGKGLDGEIDVVADGVRQGALQLTSRYGWFYGAYPFSNDPKDGRAHHFYDEARLRLPKTLPAGAIVRFVIAHQDAASWRVLDVADFEMIHPLGRPMHTLSVIDFGADPSGRKESAPAFDAAIAAARKAGRAVWIDPGDYRIDRHLIVDRVTLAGAGPWYSVLHGKGVGLFAPDKGGRRIVLKDFAVIGEVTERNDHAHLAAIGGAMSDTTISNLWLQHEKGGLWFDGPMRHIVVRDLRILDQTADGLNFHRGVEDATAENNFVRNSGDDGLASWSSPLPNRNIVFRRNTVIAPVLANGIALYGGRDATVSDNLVANALTEGGGYHLGERFKATPFEGRIVLHDNLAVRADGTDPRWKDGVGALWFYALERPIEGADIEVDGLEIVDSGADPIRTKGHVSGVHLHKVRINGVDR